MNTSFDEQQLIEMSAFSSQISDTNQNKSITISEIKQEKFLLHLCSCPLKILRSIHLPHFSDRTLRIIFLFFIVLIGLTSFTMALIIGSTVVQFKQQCPLYATFKFDTLITKESNWTVKLHPLSARFSPQSTCDFCTFYNVFTFIYCIMTSFFFILFNSNQQIVTTNDRCLIIPWFPISIILGLLALINASILTNGFLKFCLTITSNDNRIYSCTQLNQILFDDYPTVSLFFIYIILSIIASWFQLIFFIGIIAILTIRLGSSFDINDHRTKKSIEEKF